jgi:hypothetical protein
MRELHQKIGALMSLVLVVFSGNIATGEKIMGSNNKRIRHTVPPVYTTRSGSRYVRSIDVIRSEAGRNEISLQMRDKKADGHASSANREADSPKSKH